MKRSLAAGAPLLVLTAMAGAACSTSRAAAERTESSAPMVAVARVTRGDIAQSLTIAAEFRPF